MLKLIILSGKSGNGKDTAASIIKKIYSDKKCICVSYAYYLKDYLNHFYYPYNQVQVNMTPPYY